MRFWKLVPAKLWGLCLMLVLKVHKEGSGGRKDGRQQGQGKPRVGTIIHEHRWAPMWICFEHGPTGEGGTKAVWLGDSQTHST